MIASATLDSLLFDNKRLLMIAGPCAVESEKQLMDTAQFLKQAGAHVLRGGAFKPRTSPRTFQGLGEEGLKLLSRARDKTGLPVVSEVMDIEHLNLVSSYVDILQIGSRNSQNFSLLKEAGKVDKPIILKRGFGVTVSELLSASEYITSAGNNRLILAERGIRTFENSTRFTLDVSAVPVIHDRSDFPVLVDPSHPAGMTKYVEPLALAGVAAGADGLMVEVHPDARNALSDSSQQVSFDEYTRLYEKARGIAAVLGRHF
ncbi:MAG TPA: 3-deoxy-7-phosphoheptulonate synthase [Thermoplasmataceae archaeon]|nr:3-deoxy-7-phosphoheptulonate synthase [Thermoplasmataceae archaeon]